MRRGRGGGEKGTKQLLEECVGVSPQCGFASMSTGGGVEMTEERMWEKLVLVKELAKGLWGKVTL